MTTQHKLPVTVLSGFLGAGKKQSTESRWDKKYGDRCNELLIIGQDLDKGTIYRKLEECLCTASEFEAMQNGAFVKDRLPVI